MSVNAGGGRRACGFTYLGVLFAVVFMAVALALVGQLWSTLDRRAKEQQLLFVGAQFRDALTRYYYGAPPGARRQFPASLDDLLRDRRYPDIRRYLRRIYVDPLTGKAQWGLLREPDGSIIGIHSLAAGVPIKTDKFDYGFKFANVKSYARWIFRLDAAGAVAGSPAPATGTATATAEAAADGQGAPTSAAGAATEAAAGAPAPPVSPAVPRAKVDANCVMTFDPVRVQVFCKRL